MMDFNDPDSPVFCPCVFLLSVGMHLLCAEPYFAEAEIWHGLIIIRRCFMEVSYERKQRDSQR